MSVVASTNTPHAPYGYGRINRDGLMGINLVYHEPNNKKYRMLFSNGEMIVSGYPLHIEDRSAVNIPIPKDVVALPSPPALRWITPRIRDGDMICDNKEYVIFVMTKRNYGDRTFVPDEYEPCVTRIRKTLFENSPYAITVENYAAFLQHPRFVHIRPQFRMRAIQVLHFHAHTIQLLFRRNVERKRLNRCLVLEYLMMQQEEVHYLQNELVLRDMFTFCK